MQWLEKILARVFKRQPQQQPANPFRLVATNRRAAEYWGADYKG